MSGEIYLILIIMSAAYCTWSSQFPTTLRLVGLVFMYSYHIHHIYIIHSYIQYVFQMHVQLKSRQPIYHESVVSEGELNNVNMYTKIIERPVN